MKEFQWIQGIDDEKVGEVLRKIEEMLARLYPTEDEGGIKKVCKYTWRHVFALIRGRVLN